MADLIIVLYHCLSTGRDAEITNRLGRPIPVVEGQPIAALP
jgi:hypothetical protein